MVQGIGEKITPLPPLEQCWLVIAKPNQGMKTAGCFAAYDALDAVCHPDTRRALQALQDQNLPALGGLLENVLEQAVPLPQVQILRESILKNGALGQPDDRAAAPLFSACFPIRTRRCAAPGGCTGSAVPSFWPVRSVTAQSFCLWNSPFFKMV